MTPSGDASVSYLCPQCQKKLTARAEDAGQRRECPHCGKMVKVPGTPAQGQRRGKSAAPSASGGIANIPLACPLCGTRMYATIDQIGQMMVCPDCLESVVVPDRRPPPSQTRRSPAAPIPPPTAARDAPRHGEGPDSPPPDDGDFKLSEPVELPRHRSVSKALADLIDQHADEQRRAATAPGMPEAQPPKPATSLAREFATKCPVCDTMLQVTEDEIGTLKECPDCFSSIKIPPPRAKTRRVNEVVAADYDDDEFVLDDPVQLDVYRPTDRDTAPRTVGEEALRNARLAQAEREQHTQEVPTAPLWNGLFDYLPNGALITRIGVTGTLIGVTLSLALNTLRLMSSSDPSMQFFGIGAAIATLVFTIVTTSYTSINFLTVLQESAEGCQQIENWPENSLADWITESFAMIMALFFAAAPGMLIVMTSGVTGLPLGTAWLFVGFGLYVLFPITQLSILETASAANPISKPILDSLRDDFLLWCTFYIITLFMALLVGVVLFSVRTTHPMFVFIALGIFLAFAGFLYFRLLGRLAWACQMRPLLKKDSENETDDQPPAKSKSRRKAPSPRTPPSPSDH